MYSDADSHLYTTSSPTTTVAAGNNSPQGLRAEITPQNCLWNNELNNRAQNLLLIRPETLKPYFLG